VCRRKTIFFNITKQQKIISFINKNHFYRFSNFNTGGDAGRGIAKISFVACPIYIKKAQRIEIFLATAPSTFQILNKTHYNFCFETSRKITMSEKIRCKKFHYQVLLQIEKNNTKTMMLFYNQVREELIFYFPDDLYYAAFLPYIHPKH
jgi:hypothetical protein